MEFTNMRKAKNGNLEFQRLSKLATRNLTIKSVLFIRFEIR